MEIQLMLFAQPPQPHTKTSPSPKKKTRALSWRVFIDGASRGNPGPSGAGVYIECDNNPAQHHAIYLGTRTNNQAEYFALTLGAFFMRDLVAKLPDAQHNITFIADSELLVKQMSGVYKVKNPSLQTLSMLAKHLLEGLEPSFKHVLRENNKKADALANEGIDKQHTMPEAFVALLKQHNI